MRILHVGATGLIGSAVADALEARGHDVVRVGSSSGDHTVDLASKEAIAALYRDVGPVGAVVCTAGVAEFGSVEELGDAAYDTSIRNKLMGQVNLVRLGLEGVTHGGSFTLTTGTLTTKPNPGSAAVAMAGGGVEAFARAAALDLDGRFRVNVVSPGWLAESREEAGLDPEPGIRAADLADYYVRFVEGDETGTVAEAEGPLTD